MRRVLRSGVSLLGSAALTTGAVLGTVCLLATVVAPLFGVRPLIFLSGSMSPTIPAGSLALSRTIDADDIEVGDIVTVPSNGTYLTHRVVEVTHAPGKATVLLRGDGNEVADADVHQVTSAPRTEIWVPLLGAVVGWFSHAPGVYLLAVWVALVLGSLRRRSDAPSAGGGRPSPPGRPKLLQAAMRLLAVGSRGRPGARTARLARGATGVAVVAASPLAVPAPAMAAWGDSANVSGTRLSTATITVPAASCGTVTPTSITVSWTPRAGATHYLLTFGGLGDPQTATVTSNVTSRTFTTDGRFTVRARYGSDSWMSTASNEVAYKTSEGKCTAF